MALNGIPAFLHSQLFVTPPTPTTDCTGKTVIVTGANVGLGKEAARHYVRLNCAKLIIACRSPEKGEAAKADIEASTGRKGVIEVWQLDLQKYDSVKDFARRAQSLKRIDILLENAGISTTNYAFVAGNESTVTVNVVATFLLALLMLPKLQETGRLFNITPNLVIVSSEVHFFTGVRQTCREVLRTLLTILQFPERKAPSIFATLNSEKEARMRDRYNVSKLLEVFACREIAKRHPVEQMKVTMNFVNPGWCHSELMREMKNPLVRLLMRILCRTTEVGSRTLVNAGVQGAATHGKYLSNCRVSKCAPLVEGPEGPESQRRVWQELCDKLNEIEPGLTGVLDA